MNATAAEHVRHCPRCHGVILWCDGEPSPELVLNIRAGAPCVVACGRCIGKQVGGAPAPAASSPRPVDPRPRRQIIAEEGRKVVELGAKAYDIVDKIADFWDTLKPRKGPK